MHKTIIAAAVAVLLAAPGAAVAQSNTLTLLIGGEAYEGPPRFAVEFNGTPLGEGVVDTAIDTVSEGRFIDAAVRVSHVQSFDFSIPDDAFSETGEIRLRLTNEAYGGPGSIHDRNLYVVSVAVNGHEVPGPQLTTVSGVGLEPSAIFEDYLVLFDGSRDAVAAAPEAGWPVPGGGVAAPAAATPTPVVETVPEPARATPAVVEVAAVTAVAPPASPVVKAVVVAAPPAAQITAGFGSTATPEPVVPPPAAVAAVPSLPEPTAAPSALAAETAAVAAAPADGPCNLSEVYNVIGFNENSNDLTPRLTERLDQVLTDIGPRECHVQVVGYSSTQGDFATNALFAVERAQNVLRYLREQGLLMAKASATGAGETEQFGAGFSTNRRVVITVSP